MENANRPLDGERLGGGGEEGARQLAEEDWWQQASSLRPGVDRWSKDIQVTLEAPRRHGRVDVMAVKTAENGARALESAIEIETGKSDVVWNVKQDLSMGWKVLVVATDEKALKAVERELAREGLLGTGRVEVVKAGK